MRLPSRPCRLCLPWVLASLLAACATPPNAVNSRGVVGNATEAVATAAVDVIGAPLIPDVSVQLGPSVAYPLEKLVYWGLWAGAAWLILDPLAPNWEIEEARLPAHHVHFRLTMRRYYAGGAGEARVVLDRRARALMREGGYAGYEIVEYAELLDSSLLGARRTAEGVIRLTGAHG